MCDDSGIDVRERQTASATAAPPPQPHTPSRHSRTFKFKFIHAFKFTFKFVFRRGLTKVGCSLLCIGRAFQQVSVLLCVLQRVLQMSHTSYQRVMSHITHKVPRHVAYNPQGFSHPKRCLAFCIAVCVAACLLQRALQRGVTRCLL